ncbi:MAG: DUF2752 domain-containing protein [Firmicutes bacterium]|nr:DUF2752 domain-containing protein [Bacillota bacterium]
MEPEVKLEAAKSVKKPLPRAAKILLTHLGLAVGIGLPELLVLLIFGSNCPLYLLTHICCPFCGMTRAHLAALRLDFSAALYYHPVFFLGVPYLFFIFHEPHYFPRIQKIYARVRGIFLPIATVVLLAVYFYRIYTFGVDFFAAT